MLLQLNKYKY